jgi:aspartate/glutamate racemase
MKKIGIIGGVFGQSTIHHYSSFPHHVRNRMLNTARMPEHAV